MLLSKQSNLNLNKNLLQACSQAAGSQRLYASSYQLIKLSRGLQPWLPIESYINL